VEAGAADHVDFLYEGFPIRYRAGHHLFELHVAQIAIAPSGWLEGDQHHAECAVQWNLPGIRLDDVRRMGSVAPVDDDRFVSLQHGKPAVDLGRPSQAFNERMRDL
jgi:hypothetical protein